MRAPVARGLTAHPPTTPSRHVYIDVPPVLLVLRSGVPVCLCFTKDDELRQQLATDPDACLSALAGILGHAVGDEADGEGPITDASAISSEQLHSQVVGSITRRFEAAGPTKMTKVLDATNADAARQALDAAVMITLTSHARTGRGHTSCTPSSNESGSVMSSSMMSNDPNFLPGGILRPPRR